MNFSNKLSSKDTKNKLNSQMAGKPMSTPPKEQKPMKVKETNNKAYKALFKNCIFLNK